MLENLTDKQLNTTKAMQDTISQLQQSLVCVHCFRVVVVFRVQAREGHALLCRRQSEMKLAKVTADAQQERLSVQHGCEARIAEARRECDERVTQVFALWGGTTVR